MRRYRSIRTKLEREVERLHGIVDRTSKQRVILHHDPRELWAVADFRQRRELLRLIVERVDVMPAPRGAFRPLSLAARDPAARGALPRTEA